VGLAGRPPPIGVLEFMEVAGAFESGRPAALAAMRGLPEVKMLLTDGDDRAFVTRVWASTKGTEPTPAELADAVRLLSRRTVDRAGLVMSWADSPEGRRHLQPAADVVLLHRALLERLATDAEYQTWVTSVRAGGSTGERITLLLRSEELVARY
jgi:hypothetical protein